MKAWRGVLLSIAVASLAGCRRSAAPPQTPADPPPSQVLQDFEMQDIQHGTKSMTLHAVDGRLYDDKHEADLEQPTMSFFKQGKLTSTLRAPLGKIDTLTHDVDAWGGVTVANADSTTLTTERLHYDAKTRNIHTDDPVHIEKPGSSSDGVGMDTDPEMSRLRIGHQTVHIQKSKA